MAVAHALAEFVRQKGVPGGGKPTGTSQDKKVGPARWAPNFKRCTPTRVSELLHSGEKIFARRMSVQKTDLFIPLKLAGVCDAGLVRW